VNLSIWLQNSLAGQPYSSSAELLTHALSSLQYTLAEIARLVKGHCRETGELLLQVTDCMAGLYTGVLDGLCSRLTGLGLEKDRYLARIHREYQQIILQRYKSTAEIRQEYAQLNERFRQSIRENKTLRKVNRRLEEGCRTLSRQLEDCKQVAVKMGKQGFATF
jgi:hypothetical protein